ncbi:hypothetical protein QL285_061660 [Trifolium repens]|nr:hypothetical protein QL285_061660 [Trifolium repens]
MVYSIVCHLWKKSKMKKFLPLPPIPLRKSSQESSIDIQEPLSDSISEAEEEISSVSTSVLESISANQHHCNLSFGNFHSVVFPIKLINAVQPQIEGCAIKIGEITCSLMSFKEETMELDPTFDAARKSEEYVTNLVKIDLVELDSTKSTITASVSEISFSCFIRFLELSLYNDDFEKLDSEMLMQSPTQKVVCTTAAMVTFPLDSSIFSFDPGGTLTKTYYFTVMLSFMSKIYFTVRVFVFDPGGNSRRT